MQSDSFEVQRGLISENTSLILEKLNDALKGVGLVKLRTVIARIEKNSSESPPLWFLDLQRKKAIYPVAVKSYGTQLEKLVASIIEVYILKGKPKLMVSSAKGPDILPISLGVKAASKNFDTSEPFYSPYERLYGGQSDSLVLQTNIQNRRKGKPTSALNAIPLAITDVQYLKQSQLADSVLCEAARNVKAYVKKSEDRECLYCFLAYAKKKGLTQQIVALLRMLSSADEFQKFCSRQATVTPKSSEDLCFKEIVSAKDPLAKVIEVVKTIYENSDEMEKPDPDEFSRIERSPLDGRISISFALQWRYAFGSFFRHKLRQK